MQFKSFMEALKGKQHKLDKNKNGKLDAHDFKLLRKEETIEEESDAYAKSEENKRSADSAKKQGDMFAHHLHMSDYHDNLAQWHGEKGRHSTADKHAEKSEEHHELAMQHKMKKEQVELDEADYESRTDYKLDKKGRKYHKQIEFKDGSNDDAKEKHEVREEAEMNEEMSDAQMKKREDYVKGMKKNIAGFKAKYGERAKDVMYATATKMAMKESEEIEEEALDEKSEQARRNKTIKNMMDASRGARYKVQNKLSGDDVRDWDGKHKTAQAQNKAIGRALRNEDLDEEKKDDVPFDGPYKKVQGDGSVKDKSGATHTPMSRARDLARQAMKKQMKEAFDLDITDEQADSLVEAANPEQLDELSKGTLSSYVKKSSSKQFAAGHKAATADSGTEMKAINKAQKRSQGVAKAVDRLTKEEVELDEAVTTGNPGRGYHGEHDSDKAGAAYSKAHSMVKKVAGEAGHMKDVKKPNVMVKHYLDSQHGRHLKGNENAEYIKKDFGKFKKTYKPEMHENVDFDEQGNFMAEKLKFSDFIAKINEQLLEYESDDSGVYRHTKKATYGTAYQGDDDEDEKPKKAPAEKRGRGRPAGSYGGSYKARSAETKAAAAAKAAATKAAKKK